MEVLAPESFGLELLSRPSQAVQQLRRAVCVKTGTSFGAVTSHAWPCCSSTCLCCVLNTVGMAPDWCMESAVKAQHPSECQDDRKAAESDAQPPSAVPVEGYMP